MVTYRFTVEKLDDETGVWIPEKDITIRDASNRDNAVFRFMAKLAEDYISDDKEPFHLRASKAVRRPRIIDVKPRTY